MAHYRLSQKQLDRASRQIVLPEVGVEGQQRLARAKVLVIGAGGLGSPASLYLAAAGVGTIGIVDSDRVDPSNLNRQILHDDANIGILKTQSAKARLQAQNPEVDVIIHQLFLDSSNALDVIRDYDIVINGCDNFATRYLVNDACVLLGKPLVDASILKFEGQATTYVPGEGCYRCLFPKPPPPGLVPNCAEAGIIGALAGHLGTLQAMEAIKLILGVGKPLVGRMLLVDLLSGEYRTVRWRRDPGCPVCGDQPTITHLIDYEAFCGGTTDQTRDEGMTEVTQSALAHKGWAKSVSEIGDWLDSDAVQWVDVREPREYRAFRIKGTTHIPLGQLLDRLDEIDRDKPCVIVCMSGERSARATAALRQIGYDQVFNLTGGIVAWVNQRLPIERD